MCGPPGPPHPGWNAAGPLARALTWLSLSFSLQKTGLTMKLICGAVGEDPTEEACRAQAGQAALTDLQAVATTVLMDQQPLGA